MQSKFKHTLVVDLTNFSINQVVNMVVAYHKLLIILFDKGIVVNPKVIYSVSQNICCYTSTKAQAGILLNKNNTLTCCY